DDAAAGSSHADRQAVVPDATASGQRKQRRSNERQTSDARHGSPSIGSSAPGAPNFSDTGVRPKRPGRADAGRHEPSPTRAAPRVVESGSASIELIAGAPILPSTRGGTLMSIKGSVRAKYLGGDEPALKGYYPAWLDNMADDAILE